MKTAPTQLATPSTWGNSAAASSTRQLAARQQTTQFSFTTKEGDQVSFSASSLMARRSEFTDNGTSQTFTAAKLQADSYAITVKGDLNPEELQDINHFVSKLTAIAGDFFAGDYGQAMAGATSLGDLGSIATLSAEFSNSSTLASQTQWSGNHPLPDLNTLPTGGQELPSFDSGLSRLYTDTLQSRWQQISDYLQQRLTPDLKPEKTNPEPVASSPLPQLVDAAKGFLGSNPRLSPFLLPLANQAFGQAAELAEAAGKPPHHSAAQQLLAQLSGYLLG